MAHQCLHRRQSTSSPLALSSVQNVCLSVCQPIRFRESQAQYNRKPVRCQRTTVSGVTSRSGFFQPDHSFRSETQNTPRPNEKTLAFIDT